MRTTLQNDSECKWRRFQSNDRIQTAILISQYYIPMWKRAIIRRCTKAHTHTLGSRSRSAATIAKILSATRCKKECVHHTWTGRSRTGTGTRSHKFRYIFPLFHTINHYHLKLSPRTIYTYIQISMLTRGHCFHRVIEMLYCSATEISRRTTLIMV